MPIVTTGSNTTGTRGLVAVDKVANRVLFLDLKTLAPVATIDGPEPCVHELAISPEHTWAAVPLYGDGIYGANRTPNSKVLIIDLGSRMIARTIDLAPLTAPHGMVAVSETTLWVVCDIARKLVRVDIATGTVEAAHDCSSVGPHLLISNADGTRLTVSAKEGDLQVFDVALDQFVASVPVRAKGVDSGNGSGTEGLTPMPNGRHVIAIDNDRGDLRVIDTGTHREVSRVPLMQAALTNPKRSRLAKLMFSPDGRHLIVTSYASGNCWLIDTSDLERQTLIPLAKGPMGIAFAADGRSALVSSHDSGLLTRIDLATRRAVDAVPCGSGIEVMAYY
jgi:DNA-binding beta-propeller fold protein YncE